MNLGTLTATLKLNARGFTGPVRGAQGELAKTERAAAGAGAGMASFAKRLVAAGVAYKVVTFAARQLSDAVRIHRELEVTLAAVGAVSQATAADMRDLGAASREMGATTRYTANEAAEALEKLTMAGQSATTAIGSLPAVLQLATAAKVELGQSADVVTNIMAGFGKQASELSSVNDVLVATFTGSNVTLSELGEAFKTAGPVAKTLGAEMEGVAAAIGVLGNAGIKGSEAGTGLKRAMTALLNPSRSGAKAMEDLGLSAGDARKGFEHMTRKLERARTTMGAEEFSGKLFEVFGERAGPKMAALVEQGSSAIAALSEKIAGSDGLAARIEASKLDTLDGDLRLASSAADALKEAIGDRLSPAMRTLAQFAAEAFTAMTWAMSADEVEMQAQEQMNIAEAYREQYKYLKAIGAESQTDAQAEQFRKLGKILRAAQQGLIKFAGTYDEDFKRALAALGEQASGAAPKLDALPDALSAANVAVAEGAEAWASYSENVAASTRDLRVLLGEVKQISAGEFDAMLRAQGGVTEVSRREFFGVAAASPFGSGSARGLPRFGSASTPSDALVDLGGGSSDAGDGSSGAGGFLATLLQSGPSAVGGMLGKAIGQGFGPAGAVIGSAIGSAFVSVVSGGLSSLFSSLIDAGRGATDAFVRPTIGRAIPSDAIDNARAGAGAGAVVAGGGLAASFMTGNLFTAIPGAIASLGLGAVAAGAAAAAAGLLALGAESEKAKEFYAVLDVAKGVLVEAAGGIFQSMMPLAGAFLEGANAIGPFIAAIADVSGLMPLLIDAFATTGGVVADLGYAGAVTARALADWARQVAERAGQDDIAANLLVFRDNMTEAALAARDAGVAFDNITTSSAAQAAYTALLEAKAAETEATVAVTESLRQMHEQLINVAPGFNTRNAVYRADQGLPPLSPISFMMVQGQLSGRLGPVG